MLWFSVTDEAIATRHILVYVEHLLSYHIVSYQV